VHLRLSRAVAGGYHRRERMFHRVNARSATSSTSPALVEGAACLQMGLTVRHPKAMMPYSAFIPSAGPDGQLVHISSFVTDHEEMLEGMTILKPEGSLTHTLLSGPKGGKKSSFQIYSADFQILPQLEVACISNEGGSWRIA